MPVSSWDESWGLNASLPATAAFNSVNSLAALLFSLMAGSADTSQTLTPGNWGQRRMMQSLWLQRGGQLINIFLLATSPCQVSRDSVTSMEAQGAVLCTHRFVLRAQVKMVTFISSAPPSSWLLVFPSLSLIRWCYLAAEQVILCWVVEPASNFVSCFSDILCLPVLCPHKLSF